MLVCRPEVFHHLSPTAEYGPISSALCFLEALTTSSPRTRPLIIDEDIIDPSSYLKACGKVYH